MDTQLFIESFVQSPKRPHKLVLESGKSMKNIKLKEVMLQGVETGGREPAMKNELEFTVMFNENLLCLCKMKMLK